MNFTRIRPSTKMIGKGKYRATIVLEKWSDKKFQWVGKTDVFVSTDTFRCRDTDTVYHGISALTAAHHLIGIMPTNYHIQ